MFEASLAHAGLLKKILEAIKDLVVQTNFECTKTGVSVQAMDSSHVSLVSLRLRQEGFENYTCERNVTLGIDLPSMAKVLKCAGNDDRLTLKTENADSVSLSFESPKQDKVSDFELKLLHLDGEILAIPDHEYGATVLLPATEFQRICRDLAIMGESVRLNVTKEGIKFSASGEKGSGNILCRPTGAADAKEDESTNIQIKEPVSMSFALHYLNQFTKATSLSPRVCLKMSKGFPLVVEYNIEEIGYVRFYLAPKIEDEDNE